MRIAEIKHLANTLSEVDFANQPKQNTTEVGEQIHNQFEAILKLAHANYDKKKFSFRKNPGHPSDNDICETKKKYQPQRKVKPTKAIQVPQRETCPVHDNYLLKPTTKTSSRIITDLVLMQNGIKKTITQYTGIWGRCSKCGRIYGPPTLAKFAGNQWYGRGFKAWLIYQRVALRMTYSDLSELLEEQFNEKTGQNSVPSFIREFASYYAETEDIIVRHLFESPFLHADETPTNIRGEIQYVWVFTNDEYVLFRFTKTREAEFIREFLADYAGVLVSDFYPGYDSLNCRQQKCWVHLIRDLNSDLWTAPLDTEFEVYVTEIRELIIPIMETIQRYGPKKRNLNKFRKQVDSFYSKMIWGRQYRSELADKYKRRFVHYRDSLFTFLEQDGIPWQNNAAERALRHLTIQEKISGYFHESLMTDYLRLLSIRQTCRFQGKSFFKFLFSGETNLDHFQRSKRSRRI